MLIKVRGVEVLVWQTGRQYTPDGQRIAAMLTVDGLAFVDYDRNVDGVSKACPFIEVDIMKAYDECLYSGARFLSSLTAVKFLQDNKKDILDQLKGMSDQELIEETLRRR